MAAGAHRRSLRKEIRSIGRGLREFQREVGDLVDWYEIDRAASSVDPVYDEGPGTGNGLVFRAGVKAPAVWIRFIPPREVQTESGLYTLDYLAARFSVEQLEKTGISTPVDPRLHFDDRLFYNGKLYRVETYEPKGWLHNTYLMVDVSARQLKPDELTADAFPFFEAGSPAWTPDQTLDWPDVTPSEVDDAADQ